MRSSAKPFSVSTFLMVAVAVICASAFSVACSGAAQSSAGIANPEIRFTKIPPRGGGPDRLDTIAGVVDGVDVKTCACRLVLFSQTNRLWVQPWADSPYTKLLPDNTFSAEIHLGFRYFALLVTNSYRAPATLSEEPRVGGEILQVASVEAGTEPARKDAARTIQFSGHTWRVKSAKQAGPGPNIFSDSPQSVWVDDKGRLHLRIKYRNGKYECAELILAEEHAFGTYRFTVDTPPSVVAQALHAVLGAFVWNDDDSEHNHDEVDFELSAWSQPGNDLGQFVVQPYSQPGNLVRFAVPETLAPTTHLFTWRPDRVECASFKGDGTKEDALLFRHTFTRGIPPATKGTHARINLWLFGGKAPANNQELEVVFSRFEFTPLVGPG